MAIQPISPSDVDTSAGIPDFVFEIFNDLIKKYMVNGKSKFTKDLVISRIQAVQPHSREHIIESGWLDVEPVYRRVGWGVVYDRPAFCDESFDPYYVFTK